MTAAKRNGMDSIALLKVNLNNLVIVRTSCDKVDEVAFKALVGLGERNQLAALCGELFGQQGNGHFIKYLHGAVVNDLVLGVHIFKNHGERFDAAYLRDHTLAQLRMKLLRAYLLYYLSLVDKAVMGSEQRKLGEDMARYKDGDAFFLIELYKQLSYLDYALGVKTVYWLVKYKELWISTERCRGAASFQVRTCPIFCCLSL